MKYRITHTTTYNYSQSVGLCQNEARLQPREFDRQYCLNSRLEIKPSPIEITARVDFFGNKVVYFAIPQAHKRLDVTSINEVIVNAKLPESCLKSTMVWEEACDWFQRSPVSDQADEILEVKQYLLDSPMVTASPELADYARSSFLPYRPLVDVVQDLMGRIYTDFTYDPSFTTIATPLSEVLAHRRGVCQDFAHLAIACLRSYGISARYVSGYVETVPPEGKPRLVGADASHAWFAVYIPDCGWLDFDPTNNKLPEDQHITLAWGRDFSDVTPLKGIAFGGGQHTLGVSVDVLRLE